MVQQELLAIQERPEDIGDPGLATGVAVAREVREKLVLLGRRRLSGVCREEQGLDLACVIEERGVGDGYERFPLLRVGLAREPCPRS